MFTIQFRNLEKQLLKVALEDLLTKVSNEGDFYCVTPEIENLLELLEDTKENN